VDEGRKGDLAEALFAQIYTLYGGEIRRSETGGAQNSTIVSIERKTVSWTTEKFCLEADGSIVVEKVVDNDGKSVEFRKSKTRKPEDMDQ
jgi:hypothetical protein